MTETSVKLVMVGPQFAGKTSVSHYFNNLKFDSEQPPTGSPNYFSKLMKIDGQEVRLSIWDTAGQEAYRSLVPHYYKGASLAMIMFDVTSQKSFDEVDSWISDAQKNCPKGHFLLIGNKIDLPNRRVGTKMERKKHKNMEFLM
jgi:small GTP-binding protein